MTAPTLAEQIKEFELEVVLEKGDPMWAAILASLKRLDAIDKVKVE